MAERKSIVTVDWRKYGDYSAVGQLTRKMFSEVGGRDIHTIQILDGQKCRFSKVCGDGSLSDLVSWSIFHDAAINHIKNIEVSSFYIRLSPHKATLEFACRLVCVFPDIPIVVHFMDTPHLSEMTNASARYIKGLYNFLISKSNKVFTIHESSLGWIEQNYSKKAFVVGNFISERISECKAPLNIDKTRINISYFGSIDRKMNSTAITELARLVSQLDWIELSIRSNSGVWGELKEISDKSDNVNVADSNLSELEYSEEMKKADFLLLPYNLDAASADFLRFSYSNKFIDYLENRGNVLCLGPSSIPTVRECIESKLGLVATSIDQLKELLSSREVLLNAYETMVLSSFDQRLNYIKESKKKNLDNFIHYMNSLECSGELPKGSMLPLDNSQEGDVERYLNFLIKRRFYDHATGQQSLSATIAASILKLKGYKGFDYEI